MNDIEKYIKENMGSFNDSEMPTGHKERFLKKLEAEQKRDAGKIVQIGNSRESGKKTKFHKLMAAISSMAAVIALCLILLTPKESETIHIQEDNTDYAELMHILESEIISLSEESNPDVAKEAIKASKRVTFEAVPLDEQLPAELSEREKARILREYYKQKSEGLKKIKTYLLAEQTIDEE
ncbi:MAG: hypothetical protein E7119_02185 [Bacteroidales bacterium]|nr:hypothetical protein [Bacteroidales bacterium]